MTMWWAYPSYNFTEMISEIDLPTFVISSNSDKKVMEMWWAKLNLVAFEEFSITFPSQFHDNWMELYIPYYFSKLMSIPLWRKCDGKVTILWILVLKNNMAFTTPWNCHENVMEMWNQEKESIEIEIPIFQNNFLWFKVNLH